MPTESATNGGMPPVHCAISWPSASSQADGEIVVFVDVGAERRARDVGVDLVGDRHQAVADHLERDRDRPFGRCLFVTLNSYRSYRPCPIKGEELGL